MDIKEFDSLKISKDAKNTLRSLGYTLMTKCQLESIPLLCSNKDIIVQSPTGTGKTLAYIIPCLESRKSCINSLIIVPTRELAIQIKEVIISLGRDNKPITLTGGGPIGDDFIKLKESPRLVIGTPGRLLEVLKVSTNDFQNIDYLILDEADKLLNLGFHPILSQIMRLIPSKRTTGLFSATLDSLVLDFSKISLRNPININCLQAIPQKLNINYLKATGLAKLQYLKAFMSRKLIVFFSTCASVDFFHMLFTKMGFSVKKIHGKMPQKERVKVYSQLEYVLFCTDVAARGIDFQEIELVVHFDVPIDPSNFVHRCGRTARNGNNGNVLLMLMDNELSYIDYLKVKSIDVHEAVLGESKGGSHTLSIFESVPLLPETDLSLDFKSFIDDDILQISVKAFVSYIRSYKEHVLSFILNYKELNFNELAKLHFLKKIPRMDELSNVNFEMFRRTKSKKKNVMILKRRKGSQLIKKCVIKSSKKKR